MARRLLLLALAFGCSLLCGGTVILGPALFVVVACLGVAALLAVRES